MLNWIVETIEHTVDSGGVAGSARVIHWRVDKQDVALTAETYGTTSLPPTDPLYVVPYADIVEQDAVDAIIRIEDTAEIEATLDSLLEQQKTPDNASGKPWVDNYPQWVTGVAYAVNDVVSYVGVAYKVIQAHTGSAEWPPSITPALFSVYVPPSAGPQPWVAPTGSTDAYRLGDQVTHNGNLWESIHDVNVWEPPTQWTDLGAYP